MEKTAHIVLVRRDLDPRNVSTHGVRLILPAQARHPVPWWATRALVPQLRAWLGEDVLLRAFSTRPLVALTLRGLLARLPAAERDRVERRSARHIASFPNAHIAIEEHVAAWAGALRDLLAGTDAVLIASDASAVDAESLLVLRRLAMELDSGPGPRVILGRCARITPAMDPADDESVELRSFAAAETRRVLGVLAALPCTVWHEGVELAGSTVVEEVAEDHEPLDGCDELRAWRALEAHAIGVASDDAHELALAGLRAAFGCFGFSVALPLAHELLRHWPASSHAAEVHALLALAGHYIEPHPAPGSTLDELVATHLNAAIGSELDARRRVALGYRLAIHHGRVRNDPQAALTAAQAAMELLAGKIAPPAEQALLEVWTRNARAYALHRLGRPAEAAADCEAALVLSRTPHRDEPFGTLLDVARWHLLTNLARVAFIRADDNAGQAWMAEWEDCDRSLPESARPPYTMVPLDYVGTGLERTAARLSEHVAHARRTWQPVAEVALVEALGHGLLRLGRAAEAHVAYARSKQLFELLGAPAEAVLIATINGALAAQRAGLLAEAACTIESLLADPLAQSPGTLAELEASLAAVAARRGEPMEAERRMARAAALVDESDANELRVAVACACGEARLLLGDHAGACVEFERALAGANGDTEAHEVLAIRVGLLEARASDPGQPLADALHLVPRALHDVNGWHSVPRLLRIVEHMGDTLDTSDRGVRAGLVRLIEAGLQRADAREYAVSAARRLRRAEAGDTSRG